MANVDWAKDFFQKVTSRLPDLLTEKGEGKELEALDQLRTELGAADKLAKSARAQELQAELDLLSGKVIPVVHQSPPEVAAGSPQTASVASLPAAEEKPDATRKR